MASPKLFVSYSWTNPDHEAWVLRLSTDLRDAGVDVILDKWDLKEGHDAHAFMERMVTDPSVRKVILICDRAYVEKADKRSGGVGTEAQIISGEIYAKQEQDKFVAVIKERDCEGHACVPAYYRSRIHIDLSDQSSYVENFERLLRWIYEQPVFKKPELGVKPAFLNEEEGSIRLATSLRQRRAIDAIKNASAHAIPATAEYLDLFARELEKLRITGDDGAFDDKVVANVASFLPHRDELVELFLALARYNDTADARRALHRFFEQLLPYLRRPPTVTHWRECECDNFRFLIHELFLYALAALIQQERFESAAHLITTQYYVPGRSRNGRDAMASFCIFRNYISSLDHRNKRLDLRRLSLRADLLAERCKGPEIAFRQLMQADFILFLYDNLHQGGGNWWPETLLYIEPGCGPFEVFVRAQSQRYFDRAKILLGIESKADLMPLLRAFAACERRIPSWQSSSFDPPELLGFDELAMVP